MKVSRSESDRFASTCHWSRETPFYWYQPSRVKTIVVRQKGWYKVDGGVREVRVNIFSHTLDKKVWQGEIQIQRAIVGLHGVARAPPR